MADQNIIDYIERARKSDGLSEEVIKENLLFVGWQEREIDEAFQAIDAGARGEGALFFSPEQKISQKSLKSKDYQTISIPFLIY